jgi:hypothetical protein
MDELEDEGANIDEFMGRFTRETFANPKNTRARLKAERRAGLSPKQRTHLGSPPKKQVNFRADEQTRTLIARLSTHYKLDKTALLVLAIAKLAEASLGGAQ